MRISREKRLFSPFRLFPLGDRPLGQVPFAARPAGQRLPDAVGLGDRHELHALRQASDLELARADQVTQPRIGAAHVRDRLCDREVCAALELVRHADHDRILPIAGS
ncbi:hypothetical protein EB077_11190 [bacterium]|nr:hypothetical protein [bacterium]